MLCTATTAHVNKVLIGPPTLREALHIHVFMRRLRDHMAHFYGLHPRIRCAFLNQCASLWVRLKHAANEGTTGMRIEITDRRRGSALLRVDTRVRICYERAVRRNCRTPGMLLEVQEVVYDADGPNVD